MVSAHDVSLLLMNNSMFEIVYQNLDHSNRHEVTYEMWLDAMVDVPVEVEHLMGAESKKKYEIMFE